METNKIINGERRRYKQKFINGKQISEHRLVMEEYLGRKLLKNEIIHHKDRNKFNNDISNLELTNRKEHPKIHFAKGKFKYCIGCNKQVWFSPAQINRLKGEYICRKCFVEKKINRICLICSKEFLGYFNQKFCKNCLKESHRRNWYKWKSKKFKIRN